MVSAINPLLPEDGVPAVKADLRANLLAAKSEIEALQAGGATGYMRNLAGAVSRTLGQLAIDQGLNVKEFGALGDGSGTTIQQWLTGGSHDRGYASLAAIQADFPHAEALSDTIDWVALQKCCDLAAGTTIFSSRVYLPGGNYVINRTLQITRGNSAGDFLSVTFEGDGRFDVGQSGTRITASSFLNAPAIAISGARMVELQGFLLVGGNTAPTSRASNPTDVESDWITGGCTFGQFNPYTGIAIDPYAGTDPGAGSNYPVAAGEAYSRPKFSNMVRISGVAVTRFVVGIAQSPSNNNNQGDFLHIVHCDVSECVYGFSSGGTQNRDLTIWGGQFSACRELFTNNRHGPKQGNMPHLFGVGGFHAYRIIGATPRWASAMVIGGRFEAIQEICRWYDAGQASQHPLTFQTCDITMGVPTTNKLAAVHIRTTAPIRFIGCHITPGKVDTMKAGILNAGGTAGGEIDFDTCYFNAGEGGSGWEDRLYICETGLFAVPRVGLDACTFRVAERFDDSWSWAWGTNPVGQNSKDKRRPSLPNRLSLNGHSQTLETNTAPYWVQLGNNAPTSAASGYNHGTAGQLSFTAPTPADFVAHNPGSSIPGDILYWRQNDTQHIVPMLRVTGISGSTITCEKLFSDEQYDTGYAPASVQFCPRQWAPATTLTATTSGSSTAVSMSQSGVVRSGDWITDGTNVRRVAAAAGTSVTLTAPVNWSGTSVYWARLRQFTLT